MAKNTTQKAAKQNLDVGSEKAPKKETLNEKRLNIRRSIEDILDEKRQKNLYGHLEEIDE